jgi:hypothetical protein
MSFALEDTGGLTGAAWNCSVLLPSSCKLIRMQIARNNLARWSASTGRSLPYWDECARNPEPPLPTNNLSTNLITRALRFIVLRTGKYDYRDPAGWKPTRPAYKEQMKQLTVELFGSPKGQ